MKPILTRHLVMDTIEAGGDHGKMKKKKKRRRIQVMSTRNYLSGTPMAFSLSEGDFDDIIAKHNQQVSDGAARIVVDYDHASKMGSGQESKAAGWVVASTDALEKRAGGTELWAEVEFTDEAAEAVANDEWRFISPEFYTRVEEPPGNVVRHASLEAIALTNRPVMNDMAAIAASKSQNTEFLMVPIADTPKEDTMDQKELMAAVKATVNESLSEVKDTFTASVKDVVNDLVTSKIQEVFDKNETRTASEKAVDVVLQPHVDRGALSVHEMNMAKTTILASEKYEKPLADYDTMFKKIPDGETPDSTVKGSGEDLDTVTASFTKHLDDQVEKGVEYGDALRASIKQFGEAAYERYSWSETEKGHERPTVFDEDEGSDGGGRTIQEF